MLPWLLDRPPLLTKRTRRCQQGRRSRSAVRSDSRVDTFTGGYAPRRLRTYRELVRYHRVKTRAFASNDLTVALSGDWAAFQRYGHVPFERATVLEIGCGQRAGVAFILNTLGARVVAVDYDYTEGHVTLRALSRTARRNGLERAIKTLGRHVIFDGEYYRTIERGLGRPLIRTGVEIHSMDACRLSFPDRSFDYAVSHAAFEHIHNIDAAASELQRVLRPDGIARIEVHPFPSLSGGHRLEWAYPEERVPSNVPPWDHLRQNEFPAHVYLNRLRSDDYLRTFGAYFTILDTATHQEGSQQMTPALRRELSHYSMDELTTRALIIVLANDRPRADLSASASARKDHNEAAE